jgi:hypothetical protein
MAPPTKPLFVRVVELASDRHIASDVPTWVSSFDIQSAFPNLAQQLAHKQESRVTVVLTNNGWQVNTP